MIASKLDMLSTLEKHGSENMDRISLQACIELFATSVVIALHLVPPLKMLAFNEKYISLKKAVHLIKYILGRWLE